MKRIFALLTILVSALSVAHGQTTPAAVLSGTVTDPSGAAIPGAVVLLRGEGGTQRAGTDENGRYSLPAVRSGAYTVRVLSAGFAPAEQKVELTATRTLDFQLQIASEAQSITVQEELTQVTTDPGSNASAIVLGQKELEALSDDPDELEQQLQAMAGPSTGPNGGQIYIDGFTGGNLPPKASIREVRINSNPFSSEYDRPGFGRIEIFTRPGSDKIRGQAFFQFNNESLNSRSPLLAQPSLPPYQQTFAGFSLSGPIKKSKASFGFDFERRRIDDNAFILATTLDDNFNLQQINQGIVTPQTRTNFSPRIDYSINTNHTLVARFQHTRMSSENEGVGDFSLLSRAYNQRSTENSFQITETAVLSPRAINETRFQFRRTEMANLGDNTIPAITVQGAFSGGGAQIGNSGTLVNSWEVQNSTTYTRGAHTIKFGARLRQSFLDDTSVNNFGGSYTFFGGFGPALDANNLPIDGTSVELTALERYRRTLLFQNMGYTAAQIRAAGGGASQFTLSAGLPLTSVNQFDLGLFVNDDWRMLPNLTLSYGLRYEAQTNISDLANLSPRLALAWGIDGGRNKAAKTVLRAGFGVFYDRIAENLTLQALRFNGATQQAYLIRNPDFFPLIPTVETLAAGQQPQRLQIMDANLVAPRTYQASIGVERQINRYARLSAMYVSTRGVHLQRSRNINTPIDGLYPFGDSQLRFLTETTGFSRTNQFIVSPNLNYKGLFLFGFYSLSYGKSDAEGQPADPYNLRAEWGPSSFADVRHRAVVGTNVPLPWKISLNPFVFMSSGSPYNITTGRDLNGDGLASERPALVGLDAASCAGSSLRYAPGFGCFELNPAPGTAVIGRNIARGPVNVNFNMRLSRTWSFGSRGETANAEGGMMAGGPPAGPPPGGGGGGGMRGGPGGPPPGMFGNASGKRYNLTLSLNARNLLNVANFAPPSGDLSSPFFGEYRSLAGFGPFGGNSTYNRKIDVQLRFTF